MVIFTVDYLCDVAYQFDHINMQSNSNYKLNVRCYINNKCYYSGCRSLVASLLMVIFRNKMDYATE